MTTVLIVLSLICLVYLIHKQWPAFFVTLVVILSLTTWSITHHGLG